jgi:hypothetical protein
MDKGRTRWIKQTHPWIAVERSQAARDLAA